MSITDPLAIGAILLLLVAVGGASYWRGTRERLRNLRRATLKGPNGVNRLSFQSAEDGAMELLIRRKDLKGMLKGEQLEGTLSSPNGSMVFRVKSYL